MSGRKHLDQRQIDFLKYYIDINSETRSNALQSALKAGYSPSYAEQITTFANDWISDAMRKRELMLMKAERNLDETLDLNPLVPAMSMFGPIIDKKTKQPIMKLSTSILQIKHDASKFVAETVGKRYYSKRQEIGFIDPDSLKLTDAQRKEIDDAFAENMEPKQLTTPQA